MIRGFGGLRRASRWFRNRFAPRAVILLYHRVAELPSDPQLLAVTPQHFADHLEILRKDSRPIPLRELTKSLQSGNPPRRAVVITFDDGYADNLYNARPLLERYDLPATVFVTAGYIGHKGEFWWDELDRLLLQPGPLPATLRLNINGKTCQYHLGEGANYSEDAYRRHRYWSVLENDDPSPRQRLYRSLSEVMQPLPHRERWEVLEKLLAWAGTEAMCRPTHRPLSPHEVFHLADDGLIELGAHTVTHPVLSSLPVDAQRGEIVGSKARLEEILGRSVTSFAYPYGERSDYTEETMAAVREAGFERACSNFGGIARPGVDLWQLPRFLVRDWDGEEFARRLREWLSG